MTSTPTFTELNPNSQQLTLDLMTPTELVGEHLCAQSSYLALCKKASLSMHPADAHHYLSYVQTGTPMQLIHSDETGELCYAIAPESDPEFWVDALPTEEEAIALCALMGWPYRKTYAQATYAQATYA